MAELLPEGTDLRTQPRAGTRSRYPWAEWADGRAWRLSQGEDFDVDVEKFRRTVHSHAKAHGLASVTRMDPADPKVLLVQFLRRDEASPGAGPAS